MGQHAAFGAAGGARGVNVIVLYRASVKVAASFQLFVADVRTLGNECLNALIVKDPDPSNVGCIRRHLVKDDSYFPGVRRKGRRRRSR